tara:strand:- start:1390 stop:1572 length:183 start_codon:yes stop_codon:yes gene_type:complete
MAEMTKYEKAKAILVASDPEKFIGFKLENSSLHILYRLNDHEEVFILSEEEVNTLAESFD